MVKLKKKLMEKWKINEIDRDINNFSISFYIYILSKLLYALSLIQIIPILDDYAKELVSLIQNVLVVLSSLYYTQKFAPKAFNSKTELDGIDREEYVQIVRIQKDVN